MNKIIEFDREELHILKELVKPNLVDLERKVFSEADVSIIKDVVKDEIKKTVDYINTHLNDDITAFSNKYNALYRIKLKIA